MLGALRADATGTGCLRPGFPLRDDEHQRHRKLCDGVFVCRDVGTSHSAAGPAHYGQRQRWFLMRLLGDDAEINIATEHPEFSAWRWVAPEQIIELIVSFERRLYLDVLEEFAVSLPHMS